MPPFSFLDYTMNDYAPSLVELPSLGTLTHQAVTLRRNLDQITKLEYPLEACEIRDIILSLVEFILQEFSPTDHDVPPLEPHRLRSLGAVVQELYAYLRYIRAALPRQSPPGIQLALTELVELYFPTEANGRPVCVVRPQWTYNLKCVHLNGHLSHILNPAVLDPYDNFEAERTDDLIDVLWRRTFGPRERPKQLAVLSFAGLDTKDSLTFALLAHELGHFIDFSYARYQFPGLLEAEPLHMRGALGEVAARIKDDIRRAFALRTEEPDQDQIAQRLKVLEFQTSICIRELLADLIAARMLGFGFFAAQASFLKTLCSWSEPTIVQTGYPPGYPGMKFRLAIILHHLTDPESPLSVATFLQGQVETEYGCQAQKLLDVLRDWEDRLRAGIPEPPEFQGVGPVDRDLKKIPERIVLGLLGEIERVAVTAVPDDICARLSPRFFERIYRLRHDLPPIWSREERFCFHEIMSAAWTFQLLYGEPKELSIKDAERRYKRRAKTCRLLLKAIELIPLARASGRGEEEGK